MKKVCQLLLVTILLFGGMAEGQDVYRYWVGFANKGGNNYSIDEPLEYLSQRALDRRERYHVAIDSLDLPVSDTYVQAVIGEGFEVRHRSRWLNGVVANTTDSTLRERLEALPFVTEVTLCNVEPDMTCPNPDDWIDSSPEYQTPTTLYGADYYGGGFNQIEQLNGIDLHRAGYEGQGMIIGVCDGGFRGVDRLELFRPMREEGRLIATRDFVWKDGNVFNIHSHGTHVLTALAALQPGLYVGTAPKASYVLCRTENVLSESVLEEYQWVVAAEYLDSLGADLINTSLGYFYFDDSTQNHTLGDLDGQTAAITRGAEIAASRGMMLINSAGNDGDQIPQHLSVPADAEHVLTVGAVDLEGEVTYFSSHGPTADFRTKPDVMALGTDVLTSSAFGEIVFTSGTSLASPIMAGMMACVWQRYHELTAQQLCDSVRSWGNMANEVNLHCGYGIPDFSRAIGHMDSVGISTPSTDGQMRLYPNPASGMVAVISGDKPAQDVRELEVIGVGGKSVMKVSGTNRFDVSGLAASPYVVRISTTKGKTSLKLVVN